MNDANYVGVATFRSSTLAPKDLERKLREGLRASLKRHGLPADFPDDAVKVHGGLPEGEKLTAKAVIAAFVLGIGSGAGTELGKTIVNEAVAYAATVTGAEVEIPDRKDNDPPRETDARPQGRRAGSESPLSEA